MSSRENDMLAIQIICITALLAYLALIVLVGRNVRRREPRAFLLFLISMFIWQLSVTVVLFTTNQAQALFWYRVSLGIGSSFGFFYAVFVREFLGIRKHGWVVSLGIVLTVIVALWTLTGQPYVISSLHKDPRVSYWLPDLGAATYLIGLYTYAYIGYGMVNLILHYRKTSSLLTRSRIKYLLLGVSLVFLGSSINFDDSLKVYPIDIVANALNALIIAYAIFRFQLLDISLVLRKGLFYSIPATMIGASYFLTIYLAVNLFSAVTGYQVLLLSLVMAAITAVVFQPIWARLQTVIDRLFFREKYDTNLMLQRLSHTVSSVLDLDRLTSMIMDELTDTMHIGTAALFLREKEGGEFYLTAIRGFDNPIQVNLRKDNPIIEWLVLHETILTKQQMDVRLQFKALWERERRDLERIKAEIFVPLLVHQELIGILVLGPKLSDIPYTSDEKRTLVTLANQTAIAVQNAYLYQTAIDEKERAEVILQQAFAGIMVVDNNLEIVAVNPGAENITGYASTDLIGESIAYVFGTDIMQEGSHLIQVMQTEQPVAPVETALVSRNGRRDILLGVTRIYDGFLLNFADITQLKEVDRLKSNIVSNVSHELRTPLASIKGYTELLLDGYEGDDQILRSQFLNIINDETDRLNRLVTDLLDLSRLESGRLEPKLDYLYLDEVIRKSIDTLQLQAQKAEVSILLDISPDVPSIRADRNLIMIVVKNLIINAIKFSPKGGTVNIIVREKEHALVMEVVDHGSGISPEDLPYLFTQFYRSKSAQLSGIRGTGLGLALVKEAVKAHNGKVLVQSEPNVGTCFTVELPIAKAEIEGTSEVVMEDSVYLGQ